MVNAVLLSAVLISGTLHATTAPIIRSVRVDGNRRVEAASLLNRISTAPNMPLDRANFREDLNLLHSLGVFDNLEIIARDAGPGQVDVIYRVCENPAISSFTIEGVDESVEKRIRERLREMKLELNPATLFNPSSANKTALAVRNLLRSLKHPNAKVLISTEKQNGSVRIRLHVLPGRRLEVGAVRFEGNSSVSGKKLLSLMQHARPAPFWARWGEGARFVPEELDSDLHRIALYYRAHGFAAVSIGKPRIFATADKEKQRLEIEIPIAEGARYRLVSLGIEGNAKSASADVQQIIDASLMPREYDCVFLDETRQKIADVLGHHGYATAQVALSQSLDERDHTVKAVYRLYTGGPVAVGRIVFQGNARLPDKSLRRELRLGEGEVFDTEKLDQSVEHLNKSNLIHELHRSDVALKVNTKTGLLDITFHVKEKDRQGIYFTGGSGGNGGGYFGILYTVFDLMGLGERLSLELDGGAAQSNMLLNMTGTRLLGSPFVLALSVFNRTTGLNVANIVPGPDDVIELFRRRSAGVGLSGAYPLTSNLRAGLDFAVARESVKDAGIVNSPARRSVHSETSPSLLLDRTGGSGPLTRGFRVRLSQSWSGSSFLKSLDSTRESADLAWYFRDPWTGGRNSFALHLRYSQVRPLGDKPLLLERRLYPGNDMVRGFAHGSIGAWAAVSDDAHPALQPAGADKVMGLSAEYRVPIYGALSGAGFADLAWTHLRPGRAAQSDTNARLIEKTNGIVRSSLGGELRLQLPVLHQPARLIFSWNPLRLNTLFTDSSSALSLAEPRTALRFALGGFY